MLSEEKSPFGLRDRTPRFSGRFDPLLNDDLNMGQGFLMGRAISGAAGQLGHFRNEGLIFFAPVDNHLIFARSLVFSHLDSHPSCI